MKLRICGLLAIAASAAICVLGSAQALAQNAYITGTLQGVSVIDTATNTVTATIPVSPPPFGVAVAPDGSRVYVAISTTGTLSVIDTTTNAVTTTIPVGTQVGGVAVTPDGS